MTTQTTQRDVVLVVDDSPDALSLINDALEEAGMDVLVALEGRQAMTIARRIRPDIILLDAIMPHMDGFETCQALKQDPALCAIPVIFMTGLTETEHVVRGLDVGGVDYLTKPINPDELLARMRVHLGNARLTQSAQSALDTTGQHLLTVAPEGHVQWATPQTHALLSRANASELWLEMSLRPQLADWLRRSPAVNDQLALRGLDYALSVRLLSHQSNGDYLFKLVDEQRGTGPALLQHQLGLTTREAEVLYWIANGKTNKEIGEILGMSPRTVNKHLEQIYPTLGVENRTSAAGVALRIMVRE
ncbi:MULTISPECIES: response regulator [Marinobacterium]|jgi:DNA-binding response OmpR family regulator/DNA-binding CsgD family transcriptional regulator|uniref:Regulatory protein, luxR family n=2 Tax=Gammaproteobacteria TaxID=1236 RepID=A0A1H4G461_9GAMM|nr:response regulator [Marinobacterium iners]SEB04334.1 regulatory protein, luxR family [Marinobacterium iners DSM 11526]